VFAYEIVDFFMEYELCNYDGYLLWKTTGNVNVAVDCLSQIDESYVHTDTSLK
jgi:hypothetical protein